MPESAPAVEPVPAPKPRRVVYAPDPRAAVVIRSELPMSERKHTKWYYERAGKRCERRATEWARRRCFERVAAE
jgi:hypothetical protein